jgi:hypothetical protein
MDDEEVGKADGSGAGQTGPAMSQSASLRPTQALEKGAKSSLLIFTEVE